MVISQMHDKLGDIPSCWAVGPGIRAAKWPVAALALVLGFTEIRKYIGAAKRSVLAWDLERLCHFFQGQTPDVAELLPTGWAPVVHSCFARRAQCVAVLALEVESIIVKYLLAATIIRAWKGKGGKNLILDKCAVWVHLGIVTEFNTICQTLFPNANLGWREFNSEFHIQMKLKFQK